MDLQLINNKKFKKNIIKINFIRDVSSCEVTKLNLLLYVLLTASKKYKTNRELIIATKNIYDLIADGCVNIYGKKAVLSFTFTFLKDAYSEDGNSLNAINFINEILFDPFVLNGEFDHKTFDIAKSQIVDEIITSKENKDEYSKRRMFEIMDINSPYAINENGKLEELNEINEKSFYDFYLDVINNSITDVIALGEYPKNILKQLKVKKKYVKQDFVYKVDIDEIKEYKEKDDINQSRLVLGYSLDNLTIEDAESALKIYLYILGAGTNSKLFTNVREKESLCYSIFSFAKYVGSFMVIMAGIDKNNYDKTVKLIKKEFVSMQNGCFTDQDIKDAKENIKTGYQRIKESPYSIINDYEARAYFGFDTVENGLKKLEKITKEDIIKVAQKISLKTIYLLEGLGE